MIESLLVDSIHFTYRQPYAAKKAQESFLESYPESKILCVIDLGGEPTEKFIYSNQVKIVRSQTKLSARNEGFYLAKSELRNFVQFYLQACELRDESEWIFVLEDDVKVYKPVSNLQFSLNGSVTEHFGKDLRKLIIRETRIRYLKYRKNIYSGCGGSIISKKVIRKYSCNEWVSKLEKFYIADGATSLGSDEILSLMTVLAGGTIGPYDEFVEPWHSDYQERKENGAITTLHRYKELYNPRQS
jgi:hypothetical protein